MGKISNTERHGTRFCLVLLFSVLFCGLTLVKATDIQGQTLSLGLYPPLLEVLIKPGKAITQVFNIQNFGDPLLLTTQVLPFTPKDELGNIHLQEEIDVQPPVLDWFSLQNADLSLGDPFLLSSGQNQQIVVKIKVPKGAPEGDYYLSLVFISSPQRGKILGPQSKAKLGANILLTVSESGKPEKSGKIVEFKVPSLVDSFGKIPVSLKVKNTGTAFFKPLGQMTLKAPFGLKTNFPLLPENVLTNSTRLLQASPSSSLATRYRLHATSLVLSGFFLGPYKLLTSFSLDENGPIILGQTSFFAFPFKLTLAFLLMIAFLFLFRKKAC